jgi:hypothetical protein
LGSPGITRKKRLMREARRAKSKVAAGKGVARGEVRAAKPVGGHRRAAVLEMPVTPGLRARVRAATPVEVERGRVERGRVERLVLVTPVPEVK